MNFEMFRPIQKVWEIEIADIVADNEIRINLLNEVRPLLQHLLLTIKFKYLSIDYCTCRIQTENIPYVRFLLSVTSDYIGDLDHRILIRFGENAFSTRTLYVEGKDS